MGGFVFVADFDSVGFFGAAAGPEVFLGVAHFAFCAGVGVEVEREVEKSVFMEFDGGLWM